MRGPVAVRPLEGGDRAFVRHLGFEVVREEPNGYGPGLPRVELRRPLRHEELP